MKKWDKTEKGKKWHREYQKIYYRNLSEEKRVSLRKYHREYEKEHYISKMEISKGLISEIKEQSKAGCRLGEIRELLGISYPIIKKCLLE